MNSLLTFRKESTLLIINKTILRQTMKPDVIVWWLAYSQFTHIDSMPANLLNHKKQGHTIRVSLLRYTECVIAVFGMSIARMNIMMFNGRQSWLTLMKIIWR